MLDSEQVQTCASQMLAQADDLQQQAVALLVAARSVEWYSPSRDTFQTEVENVARQMLRAAEEIQTLAWRALHTMDNMQEVDAFFALEYSHMAFDRLSEPVRA